LSPKRYAIEIGTAAKKDFRKLPRNIQKKIKPIKGAYRLRVGSFRVVYQVKDRQVVVLVLRIGDRKEVYEMIRRIIKLKS